MVAKASDTISREVIVNLGYVLVAIFLIISLLFLSFKAGLLAMFPNILPIILNFAYMYMLDIPLSTSTFPVAIIAMGIAVDDTIHFMVRYSKELKEHSDNEQAMKNTIAHEMRPVFSSSIALFIGFSVLLFAEFGSISQFGLLSALAMISALVSDLILTPTLLMTTPLITSYDLLKIKLEENFAKTSSLFKGLKQGEIKRVAVMGMVKAYYNNEVIIQQGEVSNEMYLILSGHADVEIKTESGDTKVVGNVDSGKLVGEMAFLSGESRTASVIAKGEVEALIINASTLQRVQKRFPAIAAKVFFNISQLLSERLKGTTKALIDKG